MLGLGLKIPRMIINSYNFSSTDYSGSYLFMTTPTPRTEINEGDSFDVTVEAENASSIAMYYKDTTDTWNLIGSATNTSGDTWTYSSFAPTENVTAIKATATYPDASIQEVENLMYSLSMYDTFTGTNGTDITSRASDSDLSGNGWTIVSGDWEIVSNNLRNTTADTNVHYLYHDCGYDDFIVECTIRNIVSGQLTFRYVDGDNHILLFINGSGLPIVRERFSAVNNDLYTGSNGDVSPDDVVRLVLIGDQFTFYINDKAVGFGTIPNLSTGSKNGFRRGGAASAQSYDNYKVIPITSNPLDTSVTYSAAKLGSMVYAKGQDSPNDDQGIADFDIITIGSTNYLIYAARDSGGNWDNISYATSSTSTPHSWTFQGNILTFTTEDVAGVSAWWDGSQWDLIYSDRDTGILYHASGASLGSLTKNGSIKDLTGSGLYLRQSSIIKEGSTWYVFVDVRTDQPSGELGYAGLMKGAALNSLSNPVEVLTNLGKNFDMSNITGISVKKEGDYYEMFYSGYRGMNGSNFVHEIGIAISKNINGKYRRVSNSPLVGLGVGTLDDITVGNPCRLPNTSILYYSVNGSGTAGGNDGYTYATLS